MASETVRVEKYSKRDFLPTQAYKQINSGLIGCQKVFAHFWLSQLGACRLGENSRNLRNPRLNICVHPHWPKLFVHIFGPQYSTHWPNTILHTAIAKKYAECLSHSKGLASSKILFFSFTFLFVEHFLQHQFSREWNCPDPQKRWRKDYMDQIRSPLGTNTITISGHFLILDFPPPQFRPGSCWEIHGLANLYESFERGGEVCENVREVWKSFGRRN